MQTHKLPPIPNNMFDKANSLYLRMNDSRPLITLKLEWAYEYLDEFEKFVRTFASCSKGCSHCCKYDVQITTLEAVYIQDKTGYVRKNGINITTGHSTPCPFLDKNSLCRIYQFRPLVCRILHAVGLPEDCMPGKLQTLYGAPPYFSNDIYRQLIEWSHVETINRGGVLRDVRDFFS